VPNRTPVVICLVLLAALGAALAATGGDGGSGGEAAVREPPPVPVRTIARRVEALRELRFRRLPAPVTVTAAQARREALEDLDRAYPPARRRADEEVLKLLGLLEPDVDLRSVSGAVFSEQVAGYYDPRTGRLRVVAGAGGNRVLDEITLAHELTHALEDQRFGLDLEDAGTTGDRALARLALVEGTATAVMFEYAGRHLVAGQAIGALAASALGAGGTTPLPPFLRAQLLFPYLGGRALVEHLHETAGGRWTVVDAAERFRPPASTEQVLHPEKYLRPEPPRRVALRAGAVLGDGRRRAVAGTWGEWATGQLLGGGAGAERAAAGWGGDRYELWRSDARGCPAPCTRADALVMRWRWDTPADEREFATALARRPPDWGARPGPGGTFVLRGGAVAVRRAAGAVTLVFAPTAALARRLAREA
jgi:hypothetical protein